MNALPVIDEDDVRFGRLATCNCHKLAAVEGPSKDAQQVKAIRWEGALEDERGHMPR